MIISQFMFYYDGKFKFNTMEFLGILLMSLLLSGVAIMNGFDFDPNLGFRLNFIFESFILYWFFT